MSLRQREGRGLLLPNQLLCRLHAEGCTALGFPHSECRGPDQGAWRGQCVWSSTQSGPGQV